MNAIIALCHFCETHGPKPLICTFTTENEKATIDFSNTTVHCNGCTSIGSDTVFISKDLNNTIFCSRQIIPNSDASSFIQQAAIRSITCEVNWDKEGGVVYFSVTQGHVLSLTFQLKDTRARGLKRWFSIVVLMKDKMLILSITSLLTEHMQKISKELQQLAEVVFDEEQKICSQRALRLKTGKNDFGQSRSLMELTGDQDVFKRLHSHFTWMLKSGANTYTETMYTSKELLTKFHPEFIKGSLFDKDFTCLVPEEECMSIRALENLLSKNVFKTLLFCCLIGIEILLKIRDIKLIQRGLERLSPSSSISHLVRIGNMETTHSSICVLEETENNNFISKWNGTFPNKLPTLMNKIESAISNEKFNDTVLHQHVKSLLMEWLGISQSLKSAIASSGAKSEAVVKLKRALGVAVHDETLIHYWIQVYCS